MLFLGLCPHPDEFDCDDDTSDDPTICDTCTCGESDCSLCARCINPGASEAAYGDPICDDGADNDCDGDIDDLDTGCQECSIPEDCEDGNPCTDHDCVAGFCADSNNTDPCDDEDPCTTDDVCGGGHCEGIPFDLDQDEDGHVGELCGGDDCDDSDPTRYPGAIEGPVGDITCTDGADNDCNGYVDSIDVGCKEAGWSMGEEANAAVSASSSREGSSISNLLFAVLLPVGAVIPLRRAFRKK